MADMPLIAIRDTMSDHATATGLEGGPANRRRNGQTLEKKMAKKITGYIKLQVPAGSANPSPPIGPALGQRGLNIMEFCKAFNAKTAQMEKGTPIPVVITAYQDRSFTFETEAAAGLLLPEEGGGHEVRLQDAPAAASSARSRRPRSAKSRKRRSPTSIAHTIEAAAR